MSLNINFFLPGGMADKRIIGKMKEEDRLGASTIEGKPLF